MSAINLQTFIDVAKRGDISETDQIILSHQNPGQIRVLQERSCWDRCFLSDAEKEHNRQTWRVFQGAVREANANFPDRVTTISRRFDFDFAAMEREGSPLLARHIVWYGVGAATITFADVERVARDRYGADFRSVGELSPEQVRECIEALDPPHLHFIGDVRDGRDVVGAPDRNCADIFGFNALQLAKQRAAIFEDAHQITEAQFLERFAKSAVSHEMEEGSILPCPTRAGYEYYQVYRKIAGSGLVAYALKPLSNESRLKPLLSFRPTQVGLGMEDGVQSVLNDLEPVIGQMGYRDCHHELMRLVSEDWFKDVIATGYSLGGAHLQHLISNLSRDQLLKFHRLIFIGNPSLDDHTPQYFAERVNRMADFLRPITMEIRRTDGDVVPFGGKRHIGWGVQRNIRVILKEYTKVEGNRLGLLPAHSFRVFDNRGVRFSERVITDYGALLTRLDNTVRGEDIAWYESLRRSCLVQALYYIILGLYNFFKALFECIGYHFFRTARKTVPAPVAMTAITIES
jgi:hypothetical protein